MTERKTLFADHHRVGKKFIPRLAGVTEVHYAERILPEIIWIAYFAKRLGPKKGIETAGILIEYCHFLKVWPAHPDFCLLSSYRVLDSSDWNKVAKNLKAKGVFLDCLDSITAFVRCYPTSNPFSNLLLGCVTVAPSASDIDLARDLISDLFNRRSREASIVQSVALWIDIKIGKYQVPDKYRFRDLETIFGDFESPQEDEVSASARMHINGNFMFNSGNIGETWAMYFWNRGRETCTACFGKHTS